MSLYLYLLPCFQFYQCYILYLIIIGYSNDVVAVREVKAACTMLASGVWHTSWQLPHYVTRQAILVLHQLEKIGWFVNLSS